MKATQVLIVCAGLVFISTGSAQHVLAEYDWRQLADGKQLLGGTATNVDGRSALRIAHTNETPLQVQLLKISKPSMSKKLYAITGEVRYENVQGDGYLEMWNFFPPLKPGMPEGEYFSRTLGVGGKMGKLSGTSNWRAFMLPFDSTGASGSPTRLEVNLFLPGKGTVYLGPMKLVEYTGSLLGPDMVQANAWWSDREAGLIGGIAGGTLGCLGSLLAWLAWKGLARRFVVVTAWLLIALGTVSAFAGILALILKQPYAVWFPLLLIGFLLLSIIPYRLRTYLKQYAALEMRRIAAIDALEG
jgi:hypothetical protein